MNVIDNIFGDQIDLDKSLVRYTLERLGIHHFYQTKPMDPPPGVPVKILVTTSGPVRFDHVVCYFSTDDNKVINSAANNVELSPVDTTWDDLNWGYITQWNATLPAQAVGTMIRYKIAGRVAGSKRVVFADNQAHSFQAATEFAICVDDDSTPVWANEAIVYHIFIDRFFPGEGKTWNKTANLQDFYGGTIRGTIEKLDYILALGFNTIWLSPFFKSPSHHGYNASNYYEVEPRLGSNSDIKELIEKAHSRGMRMLLDFVANHWSAEHPTFQDAQKNPSSIYHDWYTWKQWPDDYVAYFNVMELPTINLQFKPARDEMLRVAQYWLKEGFDGFRLDYASGPSLEFWAYFRRACRNTKPDSWIFGEVIMDAPSQLRFAGRMDGTLDFLLARSLRETFAFEHMSITEFEAFLSGHESYFPQGFSRPAFLDNHDMSRFYYIAGEEKNKLKLAALAIYTLIGPVIIYYGTEGGLSQERPMLQGDRYIFEEARMPVDWNNQDHDLLDYFKRLNELRLSFPVLVYGSRNLILLDQENNTYGYSRSNENDKVLVVFNLSRCSQALALPVSEFPTNAIDHLNGLPVKVSRDKVEITLPPRLGAFIH